MGALRKAGVWLGLVEDDDERGDDGFADEYAEDDEFVLPPRPRSLGRPSSRTLAERTDREGRRAESRTSEQRLVEHRSSDPRGSEPRPGSELRPGSGRRVEVRGSDRDHGEPADADLRGGHFRGGDARAQPRIDEYEPRPASRETRRDDPPERGSVRSLARPASGSATGAGAIRYPTQDNLALAPQVQLRERGVVGDDQGRRYQITTLHPTTYSEARTIGEHFRDGYPVIMNLTEMDEADAKRLVDFAAGLAFGLRGSFERVTNRVFLLSPANIQVTAEDKARIAEGGYFGRG
jgi:cell division inhibitor SepF